MKINLILFITFCLVARVVNAQAPLELQPLNYTENPVDIPNPDRGFVQSNDDHVGAGPLVLLPNGGSTNSGSDWIPVYGPRYIGNTSAPSEPGVIQFYIDMRHFSSGAWINREFIEKGTSQALTTEALTYLREKLQFIRDSTNYTVHLRPTYDGMGWSYRNRSSEPEPLEQCTVAGFTHLNWIQYHLLQLKPVFHEFEVGRTFARHKESGWEIDNTIAEALRWHVSSVNAKSSSIPAEWLPKFEEFIKKMGYRFELRKLEYQSKVRAGSMMPIQMWWVNVGVAPIYRKHNLVLQLWNSKTSGIINIDTDITKWLPGDDIVIEERVPVSLLEPGKYRVRIGLLDLYSGKPAIKLPIKGRTDDNWHDLGEIEIEEWKLKE